MTSQPIDAAWALLDAGKPEAALGALEEHASECDAGQLLRALALQEMGQHEAAVALFNALLERQPENPVARLNRGLALYALGQRADAAADFAHGPLFPSPGFLKRFLRTFWPVQFEHPELLARGFDDVPEQWPLKQRVEQFRAEPGALSPASRGKLARSLEQHGTTLYHKRRHALACRLFEAAWELDPEDEIIRAALSWCLLGFGFHEKARDLIEPLVAGATERYRAERRPGALPHPQIVVQWAWCLHQAGEHRPALAVLSTVRPEGPDDFGAHIVAALSWDALGETGHADRAYGPALGVYFLDTWEQFLQPFIGKTVDWLQDHSSD